MSRLTDPAHGAAPMPHAEPGGQHHHFARHRVATRDRHDTLHGELAALRRELLALDARILALDARVRHVTDRHHLALARQGR